MRRFIRITAIFLALLAGIMLAASVGVVMPRNFRGTGPDGASLNLWVAYRYVAGDMGPVFSAAWGRPGGIVESDADGAVHLPMRIYLKAPLDRWLQHKVDLIHAPALHSTLHGILPADGATLIFPDNRNDPQAWEHTLEEVHGLAIQAMSIGPNRPYWVDHGTAMGLARQVAAEYRQLLEAHGDSPRQIPSEIPGHLQFASEADKAAWLEEMRLEVQREPTWRVYLERRYGRRVGTMGTLPGQ